MYIAEAILNNLESKIDVITEGVNIDKETHQKVRQ